MIAPGDTQALPRIPVPAAAVAAGLPTVALTLAPAAPAAKPEVVAAKAQVVAAEPEAVAEPKLQAVPEPEVAQVVEVPTAVERSEEPADVESHERIYEEAMATIAALASNWSTAVERATGRHRAAA